MSLKEFLEKGLLNLSSKFSVVPFAKIFCSLALGVIAGHNSSDTFLPLTGCLLVPVVTLLWMFCHLRLPYTLLLLLGLSLTFLHQQKQKIPQNRFVNSRICVVQTPAQGRAVLDVEQINGTPVTPQRVLFVYGDELHAILRKGDRVDMTLMFESLHSCSIPGKRPYLQKGLTIYAHTHPDSIPHKVGIQPPRTDILFDARSFFLTLRNALAVRLSSLDIPSDDSAVIKAAVLGDRYVLTPQKRASYARAGVSHILAISGLHIGMVALMLNLLVGWVPNYRITRMVKQATILAMLWFYVLLTGASPSACRAAFMFSLLQYALFYRRSRYLTYNILFASAVFFILVDYRVLWNIGFQLSYLAVLAIVLLYRRMEMLVHFSHRALRRFTDTLLLTIAVQLVTAPLVMYYFGSFSLFSILSNMVFTLLLPVLLASVFLYMAIPNPLCEMLIAAIFKCYNFTLRAMERIPCSAITGYYLTLTDLIAYFTIMTLCWIYFAFFFKTK